MVPKSLTSALSWARAHPMEGDHPLVPSFLALLPGPVSIICMISGTAPNLSVPVSTSANVTTLYCKLMHGKLLEYCLAGKKK